MLGFDLDIWDYITFVRPHHFDSAPGCCPEGYARGSSRLKVGSHTAHGRRTASR